MSKYYVITAAGGNATAFEIVNKVLTRGQSVEIGKNLLQQFAQYDVEQTATAYIPSTGLPHCEMSGGEFCGNAARAMAVLLHENSGGDTVNFTFTMSGIADPIEAVVEKTADGKVRATCNFYNLSLTKHDDSFLEMNLKVVDLGGIIHVVCDGMLPENYSNIHKDIVYALGLESRDAVGVIWVTQEADGLIKISPIVWVREIDTLFFEGSCGSGSIATAVAKGKDEVWITQPTGKSIFVKTTSRQVTLASEMEVVCHE